MVHPFSVRMIMWVSEPVSLCWEVLAQADALVRLSSVLMWCIPLSRAWALSIKNTAKIPFWFSAQSQHSKPWDIWLSAIWDTEEVYLLSTPASVFMNSAALSLSLSSPLLPCAHPLKGCGPTFSGSLGSLGKTPLHFPILSPSLAAELQTMRRHSGSQRHHLQIICYTACGSHAQCFPGTRLLPCKELVLTVLSSPQCPAATAS